jgi:hypothetical protein
MKKPKGRARGINRTRARCEKIEQRQREMALNTIIRLFEGIVVRKPTR